MSNNNSSRIFQYVNIPLEDVLIETFANNLSCKLCQVVHDQEKHVGGEKFVMEIYGLTKAI